MEDITINAERYRIAIYHMLSDALKEPGKDYEGVQQKNVDFLETAFQTLQYSIDRANYQSWPELASDVSALKNDYRLSFIYPVEKRVLPVESIYRQWTFDPTVEVPFAKEKGYLMSDFALHMQALYVQYNLSIPQEYDSMPDHLCLELEFCAFLLAHESKERQAVFIKEHLSWVEELYQDAVKQDIPMFYQQVIKVIAEFLKYEMHSSEKQTA
ncbi:MAG: Nitrate reductase delta subunit [Firmicutes bacterium]|nr:Nitrate reductase delta subunit [Bacillota bacterium]